MQFWSWKFQVAISRTFFDQCMLCEARYALHINLHLRTPAQQRETSKVCSTLIHIAGTSHQKENLAFQAAEIFDRNTCNRKPHSYGTRLWAECKRLQPGRKHPACVGLLRDATAVRRSRIWAFFPLQHVGHMSHV